MSDDTVFGGVTPVPGNGGAASSRRAEDESGTAAEAADPEQHDYESLTIDDEGLIRLVWPSGVRISGPSARAAFEAVNRLSADRRRPMLVDMATTKSVAREARTVFGERSAASRIALLGRSPVDRVIANFTLGVSEVPCPTRFFTDRAKALEFLRAGLP